MSERPTQNEIDEANSSHAHDELHGPIEEVEGITPSKLDVLLRCLPKAPFRDALVAEYVALEDEIASLKAQLAESNARLLDSAALIQQISARLSKGMRPEQTMLGLPQILEAQLAEAQKDANRYRFIRNQDGYPTPEEFDVMVDNDMATAPTYKKE